MSVLTQWFQDFAARLCSPELLLDAHHTDHPTFFTHLRQQAQLVHEVSEQAFAQARAKLSSAVIPGLNDRLIARAKKDKFVPRWRGLRLVAADASTMRCRLRASQLVRNVSPSGEQRIRMTKLFDDKLYPADCFASLFHKRWGIEAAFKRLKHRFNLERITELSRHAVAQDVAAKIICDYLQALVALTAHADADLPASQRVNHAYALTALKPLMPIPLLGGRICRKVGKLPRAMLDLIAFRTYLHRENLSKPRNPGRKPHTAMGQKNC